MDKLTPEQIENWRVSLLDVLGPYALIMSVEQIEAFRKRVQEELDEDTDE